MAFLVVDDSRAMRMIVVRELRKAGYSSVVEAENGAVALDTIRAGGVELVLSDWNMPDMNGIELLTILRSEGNTVTFGFVTSESAEDIRRRAFEVGADFVVTKPFTGDELERQIGMALGGDGHRPAADAAGASELTVADVLEGLLGRKVTTSEAEPPQKAMTRAVATYTAQGSKDVYFVAEMTLAASVGCALSRMPAAEAEEWGKAHALPEAMEANFYEVANILAKLASIGSERRVLQGVTVVPDGEQMPELREATEWQSTLDVQIDGYPTGRLGFICP